MCAAFPNFPLDASVMYSEWLYRYSLKVNTRSTHDSLA